MDVPSRSRSSSTPAGREWARIVKVLVKAGDRVTAGQGLVVVEAMKMENELRAPHDGTVAAVRVSEGMSVDGRAVLIVVE